MTPHEIDSQREEMARALGMRQAWMPLGAWSSGHAELVWVLANGDLYGDTLPPFENARLSGDTFDSWQRRCKIMLARDVASMPFQMRGPR